MRKKLKFWLLGLYLVIAVSTAAFAFPNGTHALATFGSVAQTPQFKHTHRKAEKVRMSAAHCAQLKKLDPADAANQDLCTYTHIAEWSDFIPVDNAASRSISKLALAPKSTLL